MNPEPTTILTSQQRCSRRAQEQGEGTVRLSVQSTLSDAPHLRRASHPSNTDLAPGIQVNQQLDGAHSALEKSNSSEGIIRPFVHINAEYHVEKDHIAPLTAPSSATTQLGAGDTTTSSTSASTDIHVRDVQSESSGLFSSFEPLGRQLIPDTLGLAHTLKHPQSQILTEPPFKKRRPELKRRYTLGSESFPAGFASFFGACSSQLPSPKKQSQIQSPRPSTAHAIAAIRNRIREESGGVTTLKLARGSIGNGTAQRSNNTLGNLVSMEDKSNTPMEPETRSTLTGLELLGSVGIVELLEQDERPTFIIDVANPANYTPGGPLQIIFANASLCAHEVSFSRSSVWLLCSIART